MNNIILLAAAWALANPDFQAVLCKVLDVEIIEVHEAAESLDGFADQVQQVDDLFNGIEPDDEDEPEYYDDEIVHPDFEDPNPEIGYNRFADMKRDYWETFKYDYFGDDSR